MSDDRQRYEDGRYVPLYTDEQLIEAWLEDPSPTRIGRRFGVSARGVSQRLAKLREENRLPQAKPDISREGKISQLGASVPTELHGAKISELSVKLWGVAAKNADGELVTQGLDGINAKYTFANRAPEFPLLQPAHPTIFSFDSAPRIMRSIRTHLIISDAQIGRIWRDDLMVPTHDPHAMDICEQIIGALEPDELDCIGDWMDWSMLSRWPKKPEYVNTTQQGIQDGYEWWGRFIAAAGPRCKRKRKIKGNHDDRPQLFLREHNLEAMGLRRASDTTGWPVFSTEFLLRYDELGVEVSDPYPSGVFWLADDLVLMHAPPKKLEMAASVIHGHTHKLTRETWAQTNVDGRVTYFRYDIGCLCKIDGSVPSDRARTDWAQGIAVVEIIDGKLPVHNVELIHIRPERTIYRGQEFTSSLLEAAA